MKWGLLPRNSQRSIPACITWLTRKVAENIRKHGLLSTTALLDLFEVRGEDRARIEERHRPECVEITHATHRRAVVRDQKSLIQFETPQELEGLHRGGMVSASKQTRVLLVDERLLENYALCPGL